MDITSIVSRSPSSGRPAARHAPPRPTDGESNRNPDETRINNIQTQEERISLPPIHQAFPELHSETWTRGGFPPVASSSDISQPRRPITPPHYSHRTPPARTPPNHLRKTASPVYSHKPSPRAHETPRDYSYKTSPDYARDAQATDYSPRTPWDDDEKTPDHSRRPSQHYADETARDCSARRRRAISDERLRDFQHRRSWDHSHRMSPYSPRHNNTHKRKISTILSSHIQTSLERICDNTPQRSGPPPAPAHEYSPGGSVRGYAQDIPAPYSITFHGREQHEQVDARRPTLPSFPMLDYEAGHKRTARMQGHSEDEYTGHPRRRVSGDDNDAYPMESQGSRYWSEASGYGYLTRVRSLPAESVQAQDSMSPYAPFVSYHSPRFMRVNTYAMTINGDGKSRKRRGNLPKETTEKLKAWFIEHLQHPYPTEDEKQELMRLTNLQMNQISNWFINARRRQLPHLISNAMAESAATNGTSQVSSSRHRYRNGRSSDSDSRRRRSHSPTSV